MTRKRNAARPAKAQRRDCSPGGRSNRVDSGAGNKAQEKRDPLRWIYDGLVLTGYVFETGDRFEGVLSEGRSLGVFTTATAASKAVSAAARGGCAA